MCVCVRACVRACVCACACVRVSIDMILHFTDIIINKNSFKWMTFTFDCCILCHDHCVGDSSAFTGDTSVKILVRENMKQHATALRNPVNKHRAHEKSDEDVRLTGS